MFDSLHDTIVARATPPGEGAIAIVRLSGSKARDIGATLAMRSGPATSHQLVRAQVTYEGALLDDALVVEMHAPHTYTGEDVVEIHLHGSRAVVDSVLAACHALGARPAGPGEFTLRAFVHGRLDLSQAEAVADLIDARGSLQQRVAAGQLRGALSTRISAIQERLETVVAHWRAALDFPDDIDDPTVARPHLEMLRDIGCSIQLLIDSARLELRRGLRVVLCGAPNTGKSTLLNRLVGHERVIVDADPGTTRDPVEVELGDGGQRWLLCDTAGIREACGVEAHGVRKSREWIEQADQALWMIDPDAPIWPDDGLDVVLMGAKADLATSERRALIEHQAETHQREIVLWVSGKSGEGVAELRERLVGRKLAEPREDEVVVVRERHLELLRRAAEAVASTLAGAAAGSSLDVVTLELEEAARALGQILGRDVDIAILDKIFGEFCIGK